MITIEITTNSFKINEVSLTFPISIQDLKSCIKEECRSYKAKFNTLFIWDELGIIGFSATGTMVETLSIEYVLQSYKFSPKNTFKGQLLFNNQDIVAYYKVHKNKRVQLFKGDNKGALVLNNISAWFDIEGDGIKAIEVGNFKPYKKGEGIPKDKYNIKPIEEETITFVDFGFKVSVIEELMYDKGLLLPKFDIHEFANWYQAREIDLEEEGYEPIAEVEQYFKDLPIPKRFAKEVTEIYQDGGNDVYMNLVPFSGGAVEYWDIESSADAKQFPNLKKATLCYAKESIYNEFIALGIEAESL